MMVPDRLELLELIRNNDYTMRQVLAHLISTNRERIRSLVASYAFNRPKDMIREFVQRVDELQRSVGTSIEHRYERAAQEIESLMKRIMSVSPRSILRRGYAIVRKGEAIVTHAQMLKRDDEATIELQDGKVVTKVQ
jgi:exodeoxyribonuclease VII large subunit